MKPLPDLISRQEALRLIIDNVKPIKRVEKIPLEDLTGRVLAIDVTADFDVPPFDRASMDGYAVKSRDTRGAKLGYPVILKLIGDQHAGSIFEDEVEEGECIEIATGSPIPRGCDAVVKVEDTGQVGSDIFIYCFVEPGKDIAPAGEDMKKGDHVLDKGVTLTPGKIGTLAALGYKNVPVYAKPRVAIYSSGPEIIPQGTEIKPGQIYDINSYTLTSIISSNGCIPIRRGIMKDDHKTIKGAILEAAGYDIGVFSGGSSVGSKDLFGEVMEELGKVYFHGIRVKPGKPTLFGMVNGTPIFGMPGYPTSCLNNCYVYLAPVLRKMARIKTKDKYIMVPMGHGLVSKSDREQFITVRIFKGRAYSVFKQSGDITSMTHAEGYIILPIGVNEVEEGEKVKVTLLY